MKNKIHGNKGRKRHPFSKEWIDKLKKARKDRKPMLGHKHSEETKKKLDLK